MSNSSTKDRLRWIKLSICTYRPTYKTDTDAKIIHGDMETNFIINNCQQLYNVPEFHGIHGGTW